VIPGSLRALRVHRSIPYPLFTQEVGAPGNKGADAATEALIGVIGV